MLCSFFFIDDSKIFKKALQYFYSLSKDLYNTISKVFYIIYDYELTGGVTKWYNLYVFKEFLMFVVP